MVLSFFFFFVDRLDEENITKIKNETFIRSQEVNLTRCAHCFQNNRRKNGEKRKKRKKSLHC